MSTSIQFNHVSKRYRLGMTRTSLPALVSSWTQSAFRKRAKKDDSTQSLWALQDVSFELRKGNALALVGANGAGKTTILKLIAQITKPTSGEIKVNGKLSALIELGAGFHPDLSGRENIFLNGAILGLRKHEIQRRFDSIVEFSELGRFIDTPVKRYSSGMAVRLGFAVAASIDPDVLLVDEVLAVGDTAFRLKCMNRIQELIDNGTTLIFVSHNMGLVKAICDIAIYIEKGVAKQFGETDKVIEAYNSDLNQRRISEFQGPDHEGKANALNIAEVTKVSIHGLEADKENVLKTNHPARVSFQYHAHNNIDEVSVMLRIIRSDGVCVCALRSRNDRVQLSLSKGVGSISTVLDPLQLYPGTYYIVATLKNKSETIVYDLAYSEWFHVEGDMIGYEDLDAVFEPNRTWNHQAGQTDFLGQEPQAKKAGEIFPSNDQSWSKV